MRKQHYAAYAIAVLCGTLIIARLIWPKLNFDKISLSLLALGLAAFLFPTVAAVLPPIKKLKLFEMEAEFERQIDAFARSVNAAESEASKRSVESEVGRAPAQITGAKILPQATDNALPALASGASPTSPSEPSSAKMSPTAQKSDNQMGPETKSESIGSESWQAYFDEYFHIVASSMSPREKVLATAILLERMLQNVATAFDLRQSRSRAVLSPREIINLLKQHSLLTASEASAFNDFWSIRNKVVHGQISFVSEADAARILDLAWRLVRTFA